MGGVGSDLERSNEVFDGALQRATHQSSSKQGQVDVVVVVSGHGCSVNQKLVDWGLRQQTDLE